MKVDQSQNILWKQLADRYQRNLAPNQCGVCSKVLSCRSALTMHYRVHTGTFIPYLIHKKPIDLVFKRDFVYCRRTTVCLQDMLEAVFNKRKLEDASGGKSKMQQLFK